MKISYNWLKSYIDIDLPADKAGEILTSLGLEVEGIEKVESIKGGMEGIVVGYVKHWERHPNSDRLSLTKVDVGTGQDLSIVCGAPNVAKGQKVLVATLGTTMHFPSGESVVMERRKIRGEWSEGMICSEDEVGLGTSHEGIVVLPENVPVGTLAKDYYNIQTDYVFEIGLTPNRSDATNHIGVAQDLAAALAVNKGYNGGVRLPDVSSFAVDNKDGSVQIVVENTQACPRYAGLVIKNVRVTESPAWMKNRLMSIGVRPINNMVDITNFVLHEFGQPLHAFDLHRIAGQTIRVKTLAAGSTFTTLDGMERKLSGEDLMICDGDSKGMCIAGVFGGLNSGIRDTTYDIFLESAHFNPKWVRKTSMRHGLRTDAAKIFEKGSDPNVAILALKRAALLMKELGGGEIACEVIDVYPNPIEPLRIEVRFSRIDQMIGVHVPKEKINAILGALSMSVTASSPETFTVAVPTNKMDVVREVDVIEEILRVYGLNEVPVPRTFRTSMANRLQPDPLDVRKGVSRLLVSGGFFEMMAVSLSESKYYQKPSGNNGVDDLVYVNNTSNMHLDIMRPGMLYSGLEAVLHNQNRRQYDLKLFEFGRTYRKKGEEILEIPHLALFLTGSRWKETWMKTSNTGNVSFFTLKAFVQQILEQLGISTAVTAAPSYQISEADHENFAFALKYHRGDQEMGWLGKVHPLILKSMGIKNEVFFADLRWDALIELHRKHKIEFKEPGRFPSMRRDLALVIDNSVKFDEIASVVRKVGKTILKSVDLFDFYQNAEQLGTDKKSYALSFIFEDDSKTLKDEEVDQLMLEIIGACEKKLSAHVRR